MLKRLFFPKKTNLFLLLLSFFALLPFCFLIIAQNTIKYSNTKPYFTWNDCCLLDRSNIKIENYDEIDDKAKEEIDMIKELDNINYLKSDWLIEGQVYLKNTMTHKYIAGSILISKSKETLELYANTYGLTINTGVKNQIIACDELLNSIEMSKGSAVLFQNVDDIEHFVENPRSTTITIGDIYTKNKDHENIVLLWIDEGFDLIELFPVLSSKNLNFCHLYSKPIKSSFVRFAVEKKSFNVTSKSYEIEELTSGYDLLFNQGKITTAVVSVAIMIVVFYGFFLKEKEKFHIETIQHYFYEKQSKIFILNTISNLLLPVLSFIGVMVIILIPKLIFEVKPFTFEIEPAFFYLCLIQFVLVLIQSITTYFFWHKFKKINN